MPRSGGAASRAGGGPPANARSSSAETRPRCATRHRGFRIVSLAASRTFSRHLGKKHTQPERCRSAGVAEGGSGGSGAKPPWRCFLGALYGRAARHLGRKHTQPERCRSAGVAEGGSGGSGAKPPRRCFLGARYGRAARHLGKKQAQPERCRSAGVAEGGSGGSGAKPPSICFSRGVRRVPTMVRPPFPGSSANCRQAVRTHRRSRRDSGRWDPDGRGLVAGRPAKDTSRVRCAALAFKDTSQPARGIAPPGRGPPPSHEAREAGTSLRPLSVGDETEPPPRQDPRRSESRPRGCKAT